MKLIDQAKRAVRMRVSKRTWHRLSKFKAKRTPIRIAPRHAQPVNADAGLTLSCLVAYNQFGAYCVPNSSIIRPVPQTIIRGDVWEKATIDMILLHAGKGDVIHAGTYFGDFLPALAAGVGEGARVWAFEPNLENFRCAQVTLLLNGIGNVDVFNAGIGDENKTAKLLTQAWNGLDMGGLSKVFDDVTPLKGLATVDVDVMSIDSTVPANRAVTVVHLDVEGYEQKALSGGLRTIERCRPILILETEPTPSWIEENLVPLGYARRAYVDNNSVFAATEL